MKNNVSERNTIGIGNDICKNSIKSGAGLSNRLFTSVTSL